MTGTEIGIADIRPGMHVEITQRPWLGVLTTGVEPGGHFFAVQDGADDGVVTSWSVDAVGSIRLLTDPLPTTPGERFWGQIRGDQAQWWFVQVPQVFNGPSHPGVRYTSAFSGSLLPGDVEAAGLVCLPKPAGDA